MDKKKLLKTTIAVAVSILPFGLVAVGGYYAVKKYKEKSKEKNKENKEIEDKK